MDENRFAALLGHAALKVWPDLPRDAQERLFAAAVDDAVIATSLAEFLHDRDPRTCIPARIRPNPPGSRKRHPDIELCRFTPRIC
jgi:hypothetical protein